MTPRLGAGYVGRSTTSLRKKQLVRRISGLPDGLHLVLVKAQVIVTLRPLAPRRQLRRRSKLGRLRGRRQLRVRTNVLHLRRLDRALRQHTYPLSLGHNVSR